MDEKERESISNRARDFELNKPLASPHLSYSKGALDQDPISRKAEREKILDLLKDMLEFPPNIGYRGPLRDIIGTIEALP